MRFACNTCPYVHNVTRKVGFRRIHRFVIKCVWILRRVHRLSFFVLFKVNNRKYPKLKEVDDVLGGAAAWENVDSTAGKKKKTPFVIYIFFN